MPKPEIIGSVRSTYTRVVCMVCEEKAIQYVLTEKPLRAPAILAIHPFGKMPVLRHGDVELFESKAIATYLDRSFAGPHVFPSDPICAEADHDLADVSILGLHAQCWKFLQSLDRGPDQRQCAPCGTAISLIEKGSQSLDILHGVGRKKDHPTLRGCGRGSSSADPQLATHALTSSSGTASRVRANSS